MFAGFTEERITTKGGEIFLRRGGDGPPLLMLHGLLQTSACYNRMAALLASRFHVVCADLRGMGRSVGPVEPGPGHVNFSARAMAEDQREVMAALGFQRFAALGHDRGARVVHRLCLDHPAAVTHAITLDIVPTHYMLTKASVPWSWHFMSQPGNMAERMISGIPADDYLAHHYRSANMLQHIEPAAFDEYARTLNYKTIRACCEDYRAVFAAGKAMDEADYGRRIEMPLLALYGVDSGIARLDVETVWRAYATQITAVRVASGHYLPEEAASETADAVAAFLSR